MDSIELSLNQVNFEEQTLSENSAEDLHSFSNVVSYDTDFKQISGGIPVIGRKLAASRDLKSPVFDGLEAGFSLTQEEQEDLRLYSLSKRNLGHNSKTSFDHTRDSGNMDAIHPSMPDNTRRTSDVNHQFGSVPADTFTAFTETVEALALQKSVIGNSNITPASPEEVARVIAETQSKLMQNAGRSVMNTGMDDSSIHSMNTSRHSSDTSLSDSRGSYSVDNSLLETTRPDHSLSHSTPLAAGQFRDSGLELNQTMETGSASPSYGGRRAARSISTSSSESMSSTKQSNGVGKALDNDDVSNQGSLSIAGKELIRCKADAISRDAPKSSGWFWGGKSADSKPAEAADQSAKQKGKAVKTNGSAVKKEKNEGKVDQQETVNQSVVAGDQNVSVASEISGDNVNIKTVETLNKEAVEVTHSSSVAGDVEGVSEGNLGPLSISGKELIRIKPGEVSRDSKSSSQVAPHVTQQGQEQNKNKEQNKSTSGFVESTSYSTTYQDVVPQGTKAVTESLNVDVAARVSTSTLNEADSSDGVASMALANHRSTQSINSNTAAELLKSDPNVNIKATESKSYHGTSTNIRIDKNVEQVKRVVVTNEEVVVRTTGATVAQSPMKGGGMGGDTGQLMREKAKLEGHIEVLEAENKEMLRERAELLSRVAALSQELSSNKSSSQNLVGDRDALSADLETLRQNRARLEAVIMDAHKLLEEKDQEVQSLTKDLESARAVSDRYLDKLNECKQDLKSREATADDLKTKITELYVEFQTTNQNRILAVNEVESLQGEMKALAAAKDWYKEQLAAFQREKIDLQAEVTRVKTEMITQGTTIEHLKAENSRVKRFVSDMEQKSLSEKQGLARHLEMIESDMMEREAAFAQLKRDRQLVESVQTTAEEEEKKALVEDLEAAQNDARRAHSQLAVLQSEHTELSKRLALSQESILERYRMIEGLEKNREEVEARLAKTELDLSTHHEEMERLRHDKSAVEVELAAVTEEKRVFDASLKSLKEDMSKVETSFRSMKNELVAKQGVIAELQEQLGKVRSEDSMDGRGQRLIEIANVHSFGPPRHIMQALTKYETMETQTDAKLIESAELQQKISEISELEGRVNETNKELSTVKGQLSSAAGERKVLEEGKMAADRELILTKERLVEMEVKLQQAALERANLEANLVEQRERSAAEVKASLEALQMSAPPPEVKVDPETLERLSALRAENNELMRRLEEVRSSAEASVNEKQEQVLGLLEQLQQLDQSQKEKQRAVETENLSLSQQLAAVQESKRRLESDLEDVRNRATMDLDTVTKQLQADLQKSRQEVDEVMERRREVELRLETIVNQNRVEIEEFVRKTTVLETELHTARTFIEEKQVVYEETQNLAIELEREKGRLAGILKSHSALKQHASTLEQSLASKESSVVELSSHVSEELERKDREVNDLQEQVKVNEEALVKERQTAKEARKQLLTEKGAHVKARRELEQLTAEHQQQTAEIEQLKRELERLTRELEEGRGSESSRKQESERLGAELKTVTLDRDRLQREAIEWEAREATMREQIQSLEWRHSEKEAEVKAANDRIELIEDRQRYDMANLSQTLQSTTTELLSVRKELSLVTGERSELKAQIVRLKEALRMIIEQQQKKGGKMEIVIDYEELNRLLADSEPPAVESRPLSFLQATLSGLRGEISSLQLQVNEHTSAVQNSSQAWKELEAQVLDLRQVCQSSASDRAAAAAAALNQPDPALVSINQQAPPSLSSSTNQMTAHDSSISTSSSVIKSPDGSELSVTSQTLTETTKKKAVTVSKAKVS